MKAEDELMWDTSYLDGLLFTQKVKEERYPDVDCGGEES